MPRVKFIVNPAADRGHAESAAKTLRDLVAAAVENRGTFDLTWEMTREPGHASELAAQAAGEDLDVIVACGGDGTVHEIINGLMQIDKDRRPCLGIVPMGSGNDFAHNLGLPATLPDAVDTIIAQTCRPVDVGTITGGHGRFEYWNNTVGIGFSGAVNIATRKRTRLRGFMVYFVSVLETIFFKNLRLNSRLNIDGDETQLCLSMLSVCNGPREGGGFPVAPEARMDDGFLSYTIMQSMPWWRMLRFLPVVMNGQHLKHARFFSHGLAQRIRIETSDAMPVHTDGEVFASWDTDLRAVDIGIVPEAVRVLVPAGYNK